MSAYLATRNPRDNSLPTIEFVRADPRSMEYDPLVKATMSNLVGKALDADRVRNQLSSLYALDRFESIDYNLIEENGRAGLELDLRRKSWGPNYVRFGLNLEDNFEGTSRYNAALRFISTELNALGGEWLTDIQIGDNPKFFTEFYQPLSLASRYFVAPHFDFEERSVFQLQERRCAGGVSRAHACKAAWTSGAKSQNWGEIRLGMRRGTGRARVLIGDPALPIVEFDRGGYFARFSYDKLDSIFFPRHGQQFNFEWRGERDNIGADENFDAFELSLAGGALVRSPHADFLDGCGHHRRCRAGAAREFLLARRVPESLRPAVRLPGRAALRHRAAHLPAARRSRRRGRARLAGLCGRFVRSRQYLARTAATPASATLRKNASLFFGLIRRSVPVYLAAGYDQEGETRLLPVPRPDVLD